MDGLTQPLFLASQSVEQPRGKTNNVVSEQVQHKPACTVTDG